MAEPHRLSLLKIRQISYLCASHGPVQNTSPHYWPPAVDSGRHRRWERVLADERPQRAARKNRACRSFLVALNNKCLLEKTQPVSATRKEATTKVYLMAIIFYSESIMASSCQGSSVRRPSGSLLRSLRSTPLLLVTYLTYC